MTPDVPVLYQSSRVEAYREAANRLLDMGLAYPCACTRKMLPDSGVYPGTCRNGLAEGLEARSVRFDVGSRTVQFEDAVQGRISDCPAESSGDFVVRRADGLFAYQLAVVIDDAYQGVNQVVRGADLLDSTPRQILLQQALGLPTPDYTHLPVALNAEGRKLGKRDQDDPVQHQDPAFAVAQALAFLGQRPPRDYPLERLWDWALEHWDVGQVPRCRGMPPA
jgi:glutamyl-Q tRNA(Asp) synthetase